jgi:chorismate mutase
MVRDPVSEIEEIEDECQRLAATRRAIVRAAAEIGAAIGGAK